MNSESSKKDNSDSKAETKPANQGNGKANKATEEFLSGKLAQVDIARIEKELQALWKSAAEGDGENAEHSVTRACAMNLILLSDQTGCEQNASDLLDEIMLRHPCRAILAIYKQAANPSLEAWVSARCHISDSKTMKQICCEQITVRGEGVGISEISSVVMPLLVSDLPVLLWWQPRDLDHSRMAPFLHSIDKLIVDSACEIRNLAFFKGLLELLNQKHGGRRIACSDLNWRRSLPWREAVALAFDKNHSGMSLNYLQGINEVEIHYGLHASEKEARNEAIGLANQALLIAGWMASRLNWQAASATMNGTTLEIKMRAGAGDVIVRLVGVPVDEAATGDVGSIKVSCNKPDATTILAVQPKGNPGISVTSVKTGTNGETSQGGGSAGAEHDTSKSPMFRVDETDESHLIDRELETFNSDPTFAPAVAMVVKILESLKSVAAVR